MSEPERNAGRRPGNTLLGPEVGEPEPRPLPPNTEGLPYSYVLPRGETPAYGEPKGPRPPHFERRPVPGRAIGPAGAEHADTERDVDVADRERDGFYSGMSAAETFATDRADGERRPGRGDLPDAVPAAGTPPGRRGGAQ